ncbi:MAG: sigma 54-interacting transcriptional regulator [Clostridiales Family XIII bacterium]|jgi:PAS domain S-box-containing protein|nr:sigma 54-interacting transcriptional regulator [Clostridiales Family XIII bacterium]
MRRWFNDIFPEDASIRYQNKFYKLMVEYLGDEILVTDSNGIVIYANPTAAAIIGIPINKLIGKNTKDLMTEGYVDTSVSEKALEKRCTTSILQKLHTGKTVLATSVPIFDDEHEKINMVITTSKDIEEINNMISMIEDQKQELKLRDETIKGLQDDMFENIGFITHDSLMENIKDTLVRIAPLDVTVLIEGETGVGKDVAAKSIHKFSNRKDKPFVKINCGTIPENLVESILFGYDSGAFTGAEKGGKHGKLEMADGGTLFLDEIAEMPLSSQTKLLEFIQDGVFSRVGGTDIISVDVRIIAATNADLKSLCNSGMFRKDLYFRLNVIPLYIPPLRERSGDVITLTKYFITNLNKKYRGHKAISAPAMHLLLTHPWPGNVRELENTLERIYIMSQGASIEQEAVRDVLNDNMAFANPEAALNSISQPVPSGASFKEARTEFENRLVNEAYEMAGSTYKAASLLNIDQSTVARILKRQKQD